MLFLPMGTVQLNAPEVIKKLNLKILVQFIWLLFANIIKLQGRRLYMHGDV